MTAYIPKKKNMVYLYFRTVIDFGMGNRLSYISGNSKTLFLYGISIANESFVR